jgi:hypothetical protein
MQFSKAAGRLTEFFTWRGMLTDETFERLARRLAPRG